MDSTKDILFHLLIGLLVLFTCMPVHECAHAWAANKLGDPTAKNQGRLTLNPLKHLDLWGSVMLVISSISGFGFGWAKPVPIDSNNFKNRKFGMGLSALAGPVSNFILAFITLIIAKVFVFTSYFYSNEILYFLATIFSYVAIINLGLAVFNFIPIPPLDGSRIMLLILPEKIYFGIMKYEKYFFIIFGILILTNILNPVFSFLQNGAYYILDFLTGWVDILMKRILV